MTLEKNNVRHVIVLHNNVAIMQRFIDQSHSNASFKLIHKLLYYLPSNSGETNTLPLNMEIKCKNVVL